MRRSETEMNRESVTRDEMLARIRVALGGRAAEVLCYGPDRGLTTGASGDLANATNIARQMICRYGMVEEFGLAVTPELFQHAQALSSPAYQKVNDLAGKILKEQMDRTLGLLKEHRDRLDAVAKGLLEKNRLYRQDLESLLPAAPTDPPAGREA